MSPTFPAWKSLSFSSPWPRSSSSTDKSQYSAVASDASDDLSEKGHSRTDIDVLMEEGERLLQHPHPHPRHKPPFHRAYFPRTMITKRRPNLSPMAFFHLLLTLTSLVALVAVSASYFRLVSSLSTTTTLLPATTPQDAADTDTDTDALTPLSCGHTMSSALRANCTFDQLVKAWLPPACPRYGLSEYLASASPLSSPFPSSSSHSLPPNTNTNTDPGTKSQWPFFLDREQTHPITPSQLSHLAADWEIGTDYWTTGREHATHCAWMLARMAWVLNDGPDNTDTPDSSHTHTHNTRDNNKKSHHPPLRKDLLVSNFPHAKHCALFLLDRALEGPFIDDVRTVGNVVFGSC
ncbi:hypothetical protein F5Y17DRAFT_247304 [Xylariaceae sp. FL0594]|nr:hypothetical protein F5Y17DRAFT_247304 [Xylariaceae sp. FL0594]